MLSWRKSSGNPPETPSLPRRISGGSPDNSVGTTLVVHTVIQLLFPLNSCHVEFGQELRLKNQLTALDMETMLFCFFGYLTIRECCKISLCTKFFTPHGLLLVKQWLIKGLSVRWVNNFKIWRPNKISWWKHRISWWWHRIWRRPNKIYQKWLHRISWWWYRIWGRQRIRGPHFWYSGPSCKSCKGSVWYN